VNVSRRSLTYEHRLFKYSKRGFAVVVPSLDKSRIDPNLARKTLKEVSGLARLIVYDIRANKRKKPVPNKTRDGSTEEGEENEEEEEEEEEEASDYIGDLSIPWGPNWHTSQIIHMLNVRDKSQFFANLKRAKKEGHDLKQKKHRHLFITGINDAIEGFVSRSLFLFSLN
jgi:hypothetical protein